MSKDKKVTLEALRKLLGQEGKPETHKTRGELTYVFACPNCQEIGHDSDGNHLRFYPERGGLIRCYLKDKAVKPNEHGIQIYKQVKELLTKEEENGELL